MHGAEERRIGGLHTHDSQAQRDRSTIIELHTSGVHILVDEGRHVWIPSSYDVEKFTTVSGVCVMRNGIFIIMRWARATPIKIRGF